MPELPEVETIRMQLDQEIRGLKIASVNVLEAKSFQGDPNQIIGKKILGVERRAKLIIIRLEGGQFLAIHLKLTGQLIYRRGGQEECQVEALEEKKGPFETKTMPCQYTRVIISFSDQGKLFFNDLRKFGWIKAIVESKKQKTENEKANAFDQELGLGKYGPEANDPQAFTLDYFKKALSKTKRAIKIVILDQSVLAGVGNIYANEALFRARIRPNRPASFLADREISKLREEIIAVLKEAVKYKGTTDRDEAYRQISGETGHFQTELQVYGKTGQKCPECGGRIERVNIGGRGTFFCPHCQH
jgi:formamidopyrimidine-DNA glycosylase